MLADLPRYGSAWIRDCQIRGLSRRTIDERRELLARLAWFLERERLETLDLFSATEFLAYVATAHETGARWDQAERPACLRAPRPRTLHSWFRRLRTFAWWLAGRGVLEAPFTAGMSAPIVRRDRIQPFTEEEVDALIAASRRGPCPVRDLALLYVLLDTMARASEIASLRISDWDLVDRRLTVRGKGNKTRPVYLGETGARALLSWVASRPREVDGPLFVSQGGRSRGSALTLNGLEKIALRWGRAGGVPGCHPHKFRHTAATQFLRSGGSVVELQDILGHEGLATVRIYAHLAEVDVAAASRRFAFSDRKKGRR